jgi:indolepyruvate ferredoxin oxidoreductase
METPAMNAPTEGKRLIGSLEERYTATEGWVYMTGTQALVRLPIQQRLRDAAAGLNTGGYVSGYRGSPLGRYDMELWAAQAQLKAHNVVFRAGVNEDLAATAIWGAQYVGAFPGATVDGVFGIWYGKGPGVDRSGDPFRHANLAGSSPRRRRARARGRRPRREVVDGRQLFRPELRRRLRSRCSIRATRRSCSTSACTASR